MESLLNPSFQLNLKLKYFAIESLPSSKRNYETCKLPHDVDCGDRAFVQEPQKGIDPRCPRANGFFDNEDPNVCDKFYREVFRQSHLLSIGVSVLQLRQLLITHKMDNFISIGFSI